MRFIIALCFVAISSCNLINPEDETRTVVYSVTGTTQSVNITISNAGEDTEQFSSIFPPWNTGFNSRKGAFVYISAQNQEETGSVTVTITVNGTVFKSSTSSGAFVIASASGSAP